MDIGDSADQRMKVTSIQAGTVRLPFRFSFKHSLAARDHSLNIVVRVTMQTDDGQSVVGWGESVPRDYVTGETAQSGLLLLQKQLAAPFIGKQFDSFQSLVDALQAEFLNFGFDKQAGGASFCALELALLDAAARAQKKPLADFFGGPTAASVKDGITYGGVIPFAGGRAYKGLLSVYRLAQFATVKIKVGRNFDLELERLALARKILGITAKIRIDPNCAWSVEETVSFADRAKAINIASIEQPLPADDIEGLRKLMGSIEPAIVVDESLCTVEQAQRLSDLKACSAFNIRLSKVGGILPALKMIEIAKAGALSCHLGAQVGESGILSAAGRSFASIGQPFENYEGSANFFLLKNDLTRENLTFGWAGRGKLLSGTGLGINVLPDRIESLSEKHLAPIEADASVARA